MIIFFLCVELEESELNLLVSVHDLPFFKTHWVEEAIPGSVHFKFTSENIAGCTGGAHDIVDDSLNNNYQSMWDPGLNKEQCLEVSIQLKEMIRS